MHKPKSEAHKIHLPPYKYHVPEVIALPFLDQITELLGEADAGILQSKGDKLVEIRLRTGRATRFSFLDGCELVGDRLEGQRLQRIVSHLMDNSLYSRENELVQGYFTTREGHRVGICGKVNAGKRGIEHMANIGSACIRIPREVRGAADEIVQHAMRCQRYSVLFVSTPGIGKTTLLRDYVRSVSENGLNVGIADERREIACCLEGVPQLDVGPRSDVMDACPKVLALSMMVRACAPDLVAVDEIGTLEDAHAILDAHHCGVAVAATAHGRGLYEIASRNNVKLLLTEGVFDWCVVLGPERGRIQEIISLHESAKEGRYDVQRSSSGIDSALLHLCGTNAFQS